MLKIGFLVNYFPYKPIGLYKKFVILLLQIETSNTRVTLEATIAIWSLPVFLFTNS